MFRHWEGSALGVRVVFVDTGTKHHLALVRLADIHVNSIRHDHSIQQRLDRFRDKCLQRATCQRQANICHGGHHAGMTGCNTANLAGLDKAAGGFNTNDTTASPAQARDFTILDDINAKIISSAGISPCHRIVPRGAAPLLQKAAHYRIPD